MKKHFYKTIVFLFSFNCSYGQNFLNGSFELNKTTNDLINLTTPLFNQKVDSCKSFGYSAGLDLIRSAYCVDTAQNGNWYIGLTGNGADAFSIKLDTNLTFGQIYSISFYDRFCNLYHTYISRPIMVGLSLNASSFGTTIYSDTTYLPDSIWTKRTFSFVAPNNGRYITVKANGGTYQYTWLLVDNFNFETHAGINENTLEKSISYYPNPANDFIYIKNSGDVKTIRILSCSGQYLFEKKVIEKSDLTKINIDGLTNGVFFIEVITTENLRKTAKFMVNR